MLKQIMFSRWGRFLLTAVLLFGGGTAVALKNGHYLSPGLLSAAQNNGTHLGGYTSHASFELECTHCHAPVHCITTDRCQGCHMEIAKERLQEDALHGRLPATARCQTCHVEHQGRDAHITEIALENWDHNLLAEFDLEGHQFNYDGQVMDCYDCHENGRLTAETVNCVSCHETADAALIRDHLALYGTDCLACHNGHGQMAAFDHAAVYTLTDAHAATDCAACHAEHVFAGTDRTCAGCHEEPAIHAGIFGVDCARCHGIDAWTPAHLVQHTFILSHGDDETIPCETCHQDNYTDYPCFSCHEMYEMRVSHSQNDLLVIDDCIACHPTGRVNENYGNDYQVENRVEEGVETAVSPETTTPPEPAVKRPSSPPTAGSPSTTPSSSNAGVGDGKQGK